MTHTGAGPHALTPSHSCIRARADEIRVCVCVCVCECFPSDRFKTDQLPINVKITGSIEADGVCVCVCVCVGGGLLFVFLPSLMTCQTNNPPLSPLPAYLPYRVLGSTHNDHVHTTQPPPPLRYTPTRTQTHALTRTHLSVPALPHSDY